MDWTLFSGVADIGVLVHKEIFTLTANGWVLPTSIDNKERCLIFADWSSENTAIQYDRVNYKITKTGDDVVLDIYVFSINENLIAPSYGLVMYSDSGKLTFSSENVPLCYPNTGVAPTRNFSVLPFSKSMVLITDYGLKVDTTLDYLQIFYTAIVKYNNQIKLTRGTLKSAFQVKVGVNDYEYATSNIIVADKSIYDG